MSTTARPAKEPTRSMPDRLVRSTRNTLPAASRVKPKPVRRAARERLSGLEQELLDRARDAAQDAEHYVRRNPWQSVGIAAGIGLVLGVLLSRR